MPRPTTRCHACGSRGLMPFYEQRNLPASSGVLLPSRAEALSYPRGDLRLGFCAGCGFIQNMLYDGGRLESSPRSAETRDFSPKFKEFLASLADGLIERYSLRGKSILEIGCGRGDFLTLLCEKGGNLGTGIDPACPEQPPAGLPIQFIADFYGEGYLDRKADFVASRHTLEHIAPVHDFVNLVRRSIGGDREPVVFFEVPDVRQTLVELAFWDVYYEHCSYFSLGSLARLFRSCDFDVFDLRRACDDEYLIIEAVASSDAREPSWESENDIAELHRLVAYFRDHSASKLHEWGKVLQRVRNEGGRAVLWGSGSKAVSYLTNLDAGEGIEFVVDSNPERQGKFLAGTGHQVVSSEFLREYQPDVVIAMNRVYLDEIGVELSRLGIQAELTAV